MPQLETEVRLEGSRNLASGKGVFPAVPASSPAAPRYAPMTLSAQGVVYSFTIIHPNPKSGLAPFALAYVDFPEDVRVFGRLQGAPRIGMTVRTVSAAADLPGDYIFAPTEGAVA